MMISIRSSLFLMLFLVGCSTLSAQIPNKQLPDKLQRWFRPQKWQRDTDGPILSLGKKGQFDDTHIFAPAVIFEKDQYSLWYCGSRDTVKERVFRLGLSISKDGRQFTRFKGNPVFSFADGKRSVLTPTFLRSADGHVMRENGKLRMWFSATDFKDKSGLHTLHQSVSRDGIHWEKPSPAQLRHVYAPTIIKDGKIYKMWYTDVSRNPWAFRYATSSDGQTWKVSEKPVMQLNQKWERGRLFYPTVLKVDDVYLMWYGSYWAERPNTTALGFAVSLDGKRWHKHPGNPVFRPDPKRSWESHYVTSQSVIRLKDGSFRIWYASRKRPPFINKYFAINTAIWRLSK